MITKREIIIILSCIGICAFLGLRSCSAEKRYEDSQSVNEVLTEDFKTVTNEKGEEIATRKLIQASYFGLKNIHANDSSEIGRLKKLIDSKTFSATIIQNTTSVHDHGKTIVSFPADSIKPNIKDHTRYDTIYPTYTYKDSTKWQQVSITANRDSTDVTCLVHNEFDITQTIEKQGKWPFRKKVAVIKVVNKNPNTKTKELISYEAKQPKRHIALIAGISAVIGFLTAILILK